VSARYRLHTVEVVNSAFSVEVLVEDSGGGEHGALLSESHAEG